MGNWRRWDIKASQTPEWLESQAGPDPTIPFEVYIDFYGDDHETIPVKDTVRIDVLSFNEQGTVYGKVQEGPSPLVGKVAVATINFPAYSGLLQVLFEEG